MNTSEIVCLVLFIVGNIIVLIIKLIPKIKRKRKRKHNPKKETNIKKEMKCF